MSHVSASSASVTRIESSGADRRNWFLMPPGRLALLVALVYLVVCLAWIYFSSEIVMAISSDPATQMRLEVVKGSVFVAATAVLLGAMCYILMRQVHAEMEKRLQQRDALVEAEARGVAGMLAASVAHDINNVLTAAEGEVYILEEACEQFGAEGEMAFENLRTCLSELATLSDRLVQAGRVGIASEEKEIHLGTLFESVANLARAHKKMRGVDVAFVCETDGHYVVKRTVLVQALFNLVLNAAEAAQGDGRVRMVARENGGHVYLEVHDSGAGVAQQDRERVFDPFFTSKETGKGLGLLSVKACAETHGGEVEVGESDLGGALFRLMLPLKKN